MSILRSGTTALIVALCAALMGPAPSAGAVASASGTGSLAGQVTDLSGEPIGYMKVEIYYKSPTAPWTEFDKLLTRIPVDAEGRWSLGDLAAGTYRILAVNDCRPERICYAARGWDPDPEYRGPGTAFPLADGESLADRDIAVYASAGISGGLLPRVGEPTNLIRPVVLYRRSDATGDWAWVEGDWVTSGGYGSYGYGSLLPGTYRVTTPSMLGSQGWTSPPVTLAEGERVQLPDHQLVATEILARSVPGSLLSYTVDAATLSGATKLASSWGNYNRVIDVGDFDEDGYSDILARDGNGVMWLRPGTAGGAFGSAVRLPGSFTNFTQFSAIGDADGDGHVDFLAKGKSGTLYLYHGDGDGSYSHRTSIGSRGAWTNYVLFAGTEVNGDGIPDLVVKSSTGRGYWFQGDGNGGFSHRVTLTTAWTNVVAIAGVGDAIDDYSESDYGTGDIAAITKKGSLLIYPIASEKLQPYVKLGSGWSGRILI